MLKVSGLTRLYGDFVAVDNVDFRIGCGEIVGLLGHNGAGKTTIMKMISGFLEPDSGIIKISGLELGSHLKQIQQILGYLPENLPIYPEMGVADYLDYAATLKGLAHERKYKAIRRAIRATELHDRLLSPIATLSRGYKQRLGVAQAILGQPKLLILDEPTNGLDPTQTEHMRQLIRDIASEATVILSTHIMQEVEAVCDRVLILRSGRLAVNAKLDNLRHSNHLLVETNLEPKAFEHQLKTIEGIEHLETLSHEAESEQDQHYRYRLTLADNFDGQTINAKVAALIMQTGAELYQLHTEQRDLESLFREVNAHIENTVTEEYDNAA